MGGAVIAFDAVGVLAPDGTAIVDGVTLRLDERRVGLIGANGSGKTTLARCVNGLTLPTRGAVTVDGRDTRTDRRAVQRVVGFVFQDSDAQIVAPTPAEDVALGVRARGASRREAGRAARAALDALGVGDQADQAVHTLSGGERQLVALAGVLVMQPAWVVLDEPTSALDLVNRRRVVDAVQSMSPRAVIVSHDLDHVRTLDRAVLLDGGRVVADGDPADVVDAYVARVGA